MGGGTEAATAGGTGIVTGAVALVGGGAFKVIRTVSFFSGTGPVSRCSGMFMVSRFNGTAMVSPEGSSSGRN